MKEVTRSVILDLLPLYTAGEVSDDTRKLVENYLKTHPELEQAARSSEQMLQLDEMPAPVGKEEAMEAFSKAKHHLWMRALTLAIVLAAIFGMAFLGVFYLFLAK